MSRYKDSFRGLCQRVPDRIIDGIDYADRQEALLRDPRRRAQDAPMEAQRPWQTVFDTLSASPSRCVLRRQARRYLAIRVPEPGDRFLVKIFKARFADGGTQIEDFQPILSREGTFDDAFAVLAGMVE